MTSSTTSPWTAVVPVDDTALSVTDTRGPGPPVVYLNGSYASQRAPGQVQERLLRQTTATNC